MRFRNVRGLTLVEALIGCAMILIVFLAIFATFQLSLVLVFSTKAASGAASLVNERIEYIRGLEYDAIGTVGGIPSGTIAQVETVELNGVSYTLSTLIQYVDAPEDGLDTFDETGVTADYKSVRVSADWMVRSIPRSTFALTRISPPGIESNVPGGTIRINVFDEAAAPVSGAAVRIVNSSVSPAVDVTVTTGVSGSVAFPGATPGSGYQVTVTKEGHSSAQTYGATVQNPNPNPGHIAVADDTTTTLSLEINELGSLAVSTWSPPGEGEFSDSFTNQSNLAATTSATVSGGVLRLDGTPGEYPASGSAVSEPIAPESLSAWDELSWSASTSAQTSARITLFYLSDGSYVPVPDEAIPGNSAGLTASPVDLSGLPAETYGSLQIRGYLDSTDPDWTPAIADWAIAYLSGPTPLPDIDFDIHGTRTIGVASGGEPIYKVDDSYTTDETGVAAIDPLESDGYVITMPSGSSYAIAEQCPIDAAVAPGQDASSSLTLVAATAHSLRVVVLGNGSAVAGASVTLSGNSVNETLVTSSCGQVFFSGIPSGTYTLSVSATGYQVLTDTAVAVTGSSRYTATLTE